MMFIYFFKPCLRTFSVPFRLLPHFPLLQELILMLHRVCVCICWVSRRGCFLQNTGSPDQILHTFISVQSQQIHQNNQVPQYLQRAVVVRIPPSLTGSTIFVCWERRRWSLPLPVDGRGREHNTTWE